MLTRVPMYDENWQPRPFFEFLRRTSPRWREQADLVMRRAQEREQARPGSMLMLNPWLELAFTLVKSAITFRLTR